MNASAKQCRACGAPLTHMFVDLGTMPPSNAYLHSADQIVDEQSFPLRARVCDFCFLVQVDYDVPPEILFRDYAYFSSYSDSWLSHAHQFSQRAIELFNLGPGSLVVELASNDGYLLKNFVEAGIPVLGIDPSDTVAEAAIAVGVPTEVRFFGRKTAADLAGRGLCANLVVANNVLAHVPDLNDFVAGIPMILKPLGVASIEIPHVLKLIEGLEFDTIYHEHYSYFSLLAVERIFAAHGLRVYDVEKLPTHGGSLRIFACRSDDPRAEGLELARVRAEESDAGLDCLDTYDEFAPRVAEWRDSLRAFLRTAKAKNERIVGYGAAAKGNTLLNYCGVTADDISFIVDRNPHKQCKLMPGSHIPILPPEEIVRTKPHYVLVLPWNLKNEITAQLAYIRHWGGRFVIPLRKIEVE